MADVENPGERPEFKEAEYQARYLVEHPNENSEQYKEWAAKARTTMESSATGSRSEFDAWLAQRPDEAQLEDRARQDQADVQALAVAEALRTDSRSSDPRFPDTGKVIGRIGGYDRYDPGVAARYRSLTDTTMQHYGEIFAIDGLPNADATCRRLAHNLDVLGMTMFGLNRTAFDDLDPNLSSAKLTDWGNSAEERMKSLWAALKGWNDLVTGTGIPDVDAMSARAGDVASEVWSALDTLSRVSAFAEARGTPSELLGQTLPLLVLATGREVARQLASRSAYPDLPRIYDLSCEDQRLYTDPNGFNPGWQSATDGLPSQIEGALARAALTADGRGDTRAVQMIQDLMRQAKDGAGLSTYYAQWRSIFQSGASPDLAAMRGVVADLSLALARYRDAFEAAFGDLDKLKGQDAAKSLDMLTWDVRSVLYQYAGAPQ